MAPLAPFLPAITAGVSVAGLALTASSAHHARVDARNVTKTAIRGRAAAEEKRKKALKVQEGLLGERAKERRGGGFGETIVGGRRLGASSTGGKSLLG